MHSHHHQSSSCPTMADLSHFTQTLAIMRQAQSWNKTTLWDDHTQSLTTRSLFNPQSKITKYMTKNFSPSYMVSSTSGTTYRATCTPHVYFPTTPISSTSPRNRHSRGDKRGGLCFSLLSITSSSRNPENITKPTACPGIQTIKRG